MNMFPTVRFRMTQLLLAATLLSVGSHSAVAQQEKPWDKIPVPPLREFKPQIPKRIVLKNGIVIFLQEDHELPFVSGYVLIPGGSRDEDPAKVGLVDLYGEAWRKVLSEDSPPPLQFEPVLSPNN